LAAGADDVGFVSIDEDSLQGERARILPVFPRARILVKFVVRTSQGTLRSPDRSLANGEFHARGTMGTTWATPWFEHSKKRVSMPSIRPWASP
jgi:hypothetical protein